MDVVAEHGDRLLPVEVKSGSTLASDWFSAIEHWLTLAGSAAEPAWLVYGGDERQQRRGVEVCAWRRVAELGERV